MVSHIYGLSVAFATLFFFCSTVIGVQFADKLSSLSPGARGLLKNTVPAAPRFVAYNDAYLDSFPPVSRLLGFNVFAIAFLLTSGPTDQARVWSGLSPSQRSAYIQELNSVGISLIVSAFGSTDAPTSSGYDPVSLADTMASWVKEYDLQGIDVDYEDCNAFDGGGGTAEPWLISFTNQLRVHLPVGEYILCHAPLAPWFSPNMWSGGGYLAIDQSVGNLIDWFYNQGASEYTTCDGLLLVSSANYPQSALFQIAANGVPMDKLVIGKPGTTLDAWSGFMPASTLASCVYDAFDSGWNGGVMVWEYANIVSSWIQGVCGDTFV